MQPEVNDFLAKEHIGALSILRSNNEIHPAAIHFSVDFENQIFYFSTDRTSQKAELIMKDDSVPAGFVVGLSEQQWLTFQSRGLARLVKDSDELVRAKKIHYAMHPKSQQFENDPDTIFIAFKPSWWRFTDFNVHPPKIVHNAD